tara:strand:+ start:41 stop:253 length:213 start_codon:yes stop_codon:yes gene_type:complete
MAEGDVTVSITFSEAQWDRIEAASGHIKGGWELNPAETTVDANYLATHWKNELSTIVKNYELSLKTTDDF